MVPGIRSATGQNFLSFWAVFFASPPLPWQHRESKFRKKEENAWTYYPFTHVYHKWRSYDLWFLRYGARQTELFVILGHFLPFYLPNNPENQNFEKKNKTKKTKKQNKKGLEILYNVQKVHDHMQYCSWDMVHDGCNFYFLFWAIFALLPP